MTEVVHVKKENQLCYIAMNRPEKRNALSDDLVSGVIRALKDAEQDDDVKAIILSGEGKAYCSGGDIGSMGKRSSPADTVAHMEATASLTKTILHLNKYVISAVHGFAAGAGFSLALASDFIVADKHAKFIASFRNIGLTPDLGLIKLLADRVPLPIAKEWVASGKPIHAETVYEKGLINRLAEEKDVIEEAAAFATFIVEGPPFSNKFVKYLLNHAGEFTHETSLMQENIIQSLMFQSEDAKEGVQAFLEKRSPHFVGK
ncbi:enoyl-CoA hydratase/isomerase family protein [Lentibacillus sp. L22]|uniref:enoyl-CoA hydratase/isomerase family protein n=1 Tax=Lentibacillus TaxID=175304 RepID=UPI0022B0D500|nr:enoyl-CoA hydratase/isomerase family protein [Lentibacillus daqui]